MAAATLLLGVLLSPSSSAGDWTLTPRVTVSETYSDNVSLAADGSQRHDFITDVNAGLSLHGEGRRLRMDADYNLQQVLHLRETGSNELHHQWQISGDAELIERIVFLDARTTMSQLNGANTGRIGEDNLTTDARGDAFTFSVSPSMRHRFGRWADTELRLTYDTVTNDSGTADTNSESYRAETTIGSGRRFQRMPWSLTALRSTITNTDDSESKFASVNGEVSYVVSRKLLATAGAGYDDNEFASGGNETDGLRWSVGGTWTPTPRTSVGLGFEKRFFDDTYFFDLTHQSRRTRWSASYRESLTTSRQEQLDRVLVPLQDEFGEPIEDPVSGDLVVVPINFVVPTDEVIVIRAFNGAVAFTGRRTSATLTMTRSERTFQSTNDEETQTAATVRLSHSLSSRLSASSSLGWRLSEPRTGTGSGEETRWTFDAAVNYALSSRATGRLSYGYITQEDDGAASDFDENRLVASLNVRF